MHRRECDEPNGVLLKYREILNAHKYFSITLRQSQLPARTFHVIDAPSARPAAAPLRLAHLSAARSRAGSRVPARRAGGSTALTPLVAWLDTNTTDYTLTNTVSSLCTERS